MRSLYSAKRQMARCERGFTLIELLVTIAILGILMGIATSTWQGAIEGRQADSAANQLVSDLRLAHTQSTNQLQTVDVVLDDGDAEYEVGSDDRSLNDDMEVLATEEGTMTFRAEGDVQQDAEEEILITVGADGGDPSREIEVNTATSRVELLP